MKQLDDWRERIVCDDADKDEWLKQRNRFFTGSEVAALFGRHEYMRLPKLLARKSGREKDDFDDQQDHIQQGIIFESAIARYFGESRGLELERVGKLVRHPESPYLAATPDYLYKGTAVQIKFTTAYESTWSSKLPRYIYYQMHLEAAVLGFDSAVVVAYHRFSVPRWGKGKFGDQAVAHRVPLDPAVLKQMVQLAERYSSHLGTDNV